MHEVDHPGPPSALAATMPGMSHDDEQAQADSLSFSQMINGQYRSRQVMVNWDPFAAASQGQPAGSVQEALTSLREAQDIGDPTLIGMRQDALNRLVDQARPAPQPRPDFGAGASRGAGAPVVEDFSSTLRQAAGRSM